MIQVKWYLYFEKKRVGASFKKIAVQFIDHIFLLFLIIKLNLTCKRYELKSFCPTSFFCDSNLRRWKKNPCSGALGSDSYFALYTSSNYSQIA